MALVRWHVSGWSRVVSPLVRVTTGLSPAVATVNTRWCSNRGTSFPNAPPFPELSPRPEQAYHSAYGQPGTGRVYDKKPFRFEVKKNRVYHWCTCGFSHTQPFCDGSHRNPHLKITLKPIRFVAEETRSYWFCNCKQTANRPYCDGSHKKPHVQEMASVIK